MNVNATLSPPVDLTPYGDTPARWQDKANCFGVDEDLFFPTTGETPSEAKALCCACTVRDECLKAGMKEEFGVWGGLSARERKTLRRRLRREGSAA